MIKKQLNPDLTTATPKLKPLGNRELMQSRGGAASPQSGPPVVAPRGGV